MPQFAPVCPPQVYYGLSRDSQFGAYHLLLAHDVVEREKEYTELFNTYTRRGIEIILDNSVIELGNAVDLDMIVQAAKIVNPTTTVLPDVLLNSDETVSSCLKALDTWGWKFQAEGIRPDFMIIPQGRNLEDWIGCAEAFADEPRINFWGIPRNVVAQEDIGSRIGLPAICRGLNRNRQIHMLGFSDNIVDDVNAVWLNRTIVSGIDSAVPVRAVSQEIDISMVAFSDMPPRGDWWNTVKYDPYMAKAVARVRRWFA